MDSQPDYLIRSSRSCAGYSRIAVVLRKAYRVFILVVLLAATSAYIICYARKVAAHPEKSVIYGIPEDQEYTFDNATDSITVRQIAVLIVMALGFGILIYAFQRRAGTLKKCQVCSYLWV